MQSLSSLLTFPISGTSNAIQSQFPTERTSLPPPSTHIVSTATQPAPSSFLPLYHSRLFLSKSRPVIWIGCDAAGKLHWRTLLKKATGCSTAFLDAKWHFIDAMNLADGPELHSRGHLKALYAALEEVLAKVSPQSLSAASSSSGQSSRIWDQAKVLVVLDDAAALAWILDETIHEVDDEQEQTQTKADGRLDLLRKSGKKGGVKEDATGKGLAKWIERIAQLCAQHDGALWTHLTAENTTIIPPSLSNPHSSSRGGHGVGTGFDADDAGEEDDEDLVFEEVDDESETSNSALDQTSSTAKNGAKTASSALLPPDDTVDWRIDSLLRALVSSADFWIEVRGLRSGKARDCHGEICIHPLIRPLRAQGKPLPRLPLPSDPLRHDRRRDASAQSLSHLNSLSLSSFPNGKKSPLPLKAWNFECWCPSRDRAMLFRLDQTGEGVVWPRGSAASSS